MSDSFKLWLGQVTTGHGFMILAPTVLALLSGAMPWEAAVPLFLAGVAGLLWPENPPLKTAAQTLATDIGAVIAAYRNPPPVGPKTVGPTTAGMAVLAAAACHTAAVARSTAIGGTIPAATPREQRPPS